MRRDMKEVVLNAGRTKSPARYRPQLQVVDGEVIAPRRESMTQSYRSFWRAKESRLALAPLRRFIQAQVGRNWDQVYSEICGQIRGVNSQKVLGHLGDWVATNTSMLDGIVVEHSDWFGVREVASYYTYFVHPETRQLVKVDAETRSYRAVSRAHHARKHEKLLARRRDLGGNRQAHCLDGIWYEIELRPLPPDRVEQVPVIMPLDYQGERKFTTRVSSHRVYDVVLSREVYLKCYASSELRETYGRADTYGAFKRQMSAREVRQLPQVA